MFFPKRGCQPCKRRRVKCDRARPVCGQCQKANMACQGVVEDGSFIFLDENAYAGGGRKRRRGPNVTTATTIIPPIMSTTRPTIQDDSIIASQRRIESIVRVSDNILDFGAPPTESSSFQLLPALDTPLNLQALAYYARNHVEVSYGVPEVMDGHMKYALDDWAHCPPDSILNLATSAVAHATFGRARRNQAALVAGCSAYSKALVKTNLSLQDANQVTHDAVLLSAMLLSFYENSVMDKISPLSSQDIEAIASRSFAHHDGAMALLKLRRQRACHTNTSMELDKLVRRQLMRTLLLRRMQVPPWLRDGSQYGETGFALELDRYMVIVAKLRHQAYQLSASHTKCTRPISPEKTAHIRNFLAEAQALDSALARWASILPLENQYSSLPAYNDPNTGADDRSFNGTIHIYSTVRHAGLWNRYRALRIAVNAVILQTLSAAPDLLELGLSALKGCVGATIYRLSEELCESVPFALSLIGSHEINGQDSFFVVKAPTSLKEAIKVNSAYLICWPLALVITIPEIPEKPRQYLRDRLLDVSEMIDDGVLERLATASVGSVE